MVYKSALAHYSEGGPAFGEGCRSKIEPIASLLGANDEGVMKHG
ncbi:MAG: hypothetical protein WAN59_12325 [Candidatus Baltobacteraceae bacterium]